MIRPYELEPETVKEATSELWVGSRTVDEISLADRAWFVRYCEFIHQPKPKSAPTSHMARMWGRNSW